MGSTQTDRLFGINSNVAIKAPCVAVSVANIGLSGLGAFTTPNNGSYTPNDGDRILVIGQQDQTTNGIYNANATAWQRTGDFDGSYDVVQGTLIVVYLPNGLTIFYQLVTANPIIGTTVLVFAAVAASPNLNYPLSTAEGIAGVTPVNYSYPWGDVRRYGAVGNGNGSGGGTNDYQAIANALLVAGAGGPPPQLMAAIHRCDSALTVPNNVDIRGYGPQVTAIDGTNVPGSTGAVVNCTGPAFVALPALSADVAVGDTTLSFAAAPSVNIGDKIIIWNPTNSSYSGFRTYYTAGECCEAEKIVGDVVTVKTPIYAAYSHTAVNLYQLAPTSNHLSDLAVIAPSSAVQGINFTRVVGGGTRNVKVRGSGYIQIENMNCYDMFHENGDCFELLNVSNGYGISFDNSQDCTVLGGKYAGYFSGISTGGSNQTGSHVCRNIRAVGATTASTQHVQGDGSANIHGNSEYCYYDNCTIFDGLNLAGNHCGARNSTIIVSSAALGVAVLFTEMSGCDHDLSGTKIVSSGNPNPGTSAVIDIGVNNVTAMNANTTAGGTISLRGVKISAPSATGNIVFVRNRGATVTYEVDCTAMQVDAPLVSGAGVSTVPVSGNDPVAIHLEGARFTGTTLPGNTIPFASITAANTKVTGYRCQGSVGLNTSTSAPDVATAVTFPRPAPKTPNVFCACNQTLGGSTDSYIVAPVGLSATGFNAEIANGKAVNFTAVVALTVAWTASLDESQ